MPNLVSLAEAASYLGVSKATLRNWDKEGKLRAHRHPLNRYRAYDLEELRSIKTQASFLENSDTEILPPPPLQVTDMRAVKRVISRLHAIIRDSDGDSSIIERFDELTKLLFLKLIADSNGTSLFATKEGEDSKSYGRRVRKEYATQAGRYPTLISERFSKLLCSDNAISQCGTVLAACSFSSAKFDLKGVAYEEIIRGTFDKSDHQQFFTPHQVVSFMVAMLQPYLSGTIMDPACGTGGFLAEIVRSNTKHTKLIGLEIDERLEWVAGINLLLHGADHFENVCLGNGGTLGKLARPYFERANAILTNPPFGSDFTDKMALQELELGKDRTSRRRGILFIERCWTLLKDGGVVGIIIDEGVLNLPSAMDVRQFILNRFDILAIISLPETAFMPYATVNASILVLRKSHAPVRSSEVFFGKADNIGRKSNGDDDILYEEGGNPRLNSDLPEILQCWQAFIGGHRNVETNDKVFVANVATNLEGDDSFRLDFRYHHPSRNRSRVLLEHSKHKLISVADLCEERNEIVIPSKEMGDQVILYTGLANIEVANGVAHQVPTPAASLKSAVRRYEPQDIVFARMRPNLRKVALMSFSEGGYISPECYVLCVRKDSSGRNLIDPEILAAVLRSDLVFGQILHLIAGIGRPRLNTTDLRRVLIPLPPLLIQQECKAEFQGRVASSRQLQAKAQTLLEEARTLEMKAVDELSNRMIGG